jgi:hypothetical protein
MDDVSHMSPPEYLAGVRLVGGTVLASAAMLVTCGWLAIGGSAFGTSPAVDEPYPVQVDVARSKVAPVPHRTAPGTPMAHHKRTRQHSRGGAPRSALAAPHRSSTPVPSLTPAPTSEASSPPAASPVPSVTAAPPQLPAPVELPTVIPVPAVPSVAVVDEVVSAVGLP